jgi:putative oxidoreductase
MKKLFSTYCSDGAFSFAMLVLRLGAGILLMVNHGFDKLIHFSSKAPHFTDPFHIGSTPSLAMVVFAEFFCAVFVIMGLFTRLACVPIIISLAVALFYAHHGNAFNIGESAALFLSCFVAILFAGPGNASLDRFVGK